MAIKHIMSSNLVTVELDDSLSAIKDIFDHCQFHHLLVVEHEKLCGIISDRDLLMALSPNLATAAETEKDLASLNKRAHQIMSRKPITLDPSATIFEAVDLLIAHPISCIAVVDQQGKAVGIVTWRDILQRLSENHKKKTNDDKS